MAEVEGNVDVQQMVHALSKGYFSRQFYTVFLIEIIVQSFNLFFGFDSMI